MTSKTFKYLDAIFSHSGSFIVLNECVSERATKYGISKKRRTSFLSIDDQLHFAEKYWCT